MLKHPLSKIAYQDWQNIKATNQFSETAAEKVRFIEESSLANEPFRKNESLKFAQKINETLVTEPPVFVLGHWRSGTTHLQNILSNDDRFGYLNVVQSLNPHTFLSREKQYLSEFQETRRFMDNVILTGDAPSEEEVALGILAPGSFWHGYYLTDKMDYYFNKYTLFKTINPLELEAWKESYLFLLKKLTLRNQGKALFLKNPPNTARIKVLLEMFPNAKFIHIRRNPYLVFFSRMKQYRSAVKFKTLQELSEKEWEKKVFVYYKEMMQKHFAERSLIPENQYIEVSFEDLKQKPIEILDSIYTKLELPDFNQTEGIFSTYLNGLKDYQQNTYSFEKTALDRIYEQWNFTIDKWNYTTP
jgi:hypothetical protein